MVVARLSAALLVLLAVGLTVIGVRALVGATGHPDAAPEQLVVLGLLSLGVAAVLAYAASRSWSATR